MKPTFEEIWSRIGGILERSLNKSEVENSLMNLEGGILFLVGQTIILLRVILKKPVI